jgi:hypothetical protein
VRHENVCDVLCQAPTNDPQRTLESDLKKLSDIQAEIESLVADRTCSNADDCAARTYGSKACGGPSSYVVYSTPNVDEALLTQKLQEYTDLQQSINEYYQLNSDCSLVSKPLVGCLNNHCVAAGFTNP